MQIVLFQWVADRNYWYIILGVDEGSVQDTCKENRTIISSLPLWLEFVALLQAFYVHDREARLYFKEIQRSRGKFSPKDRR